MSKEKWLNVDVESEKWSESLTRTSTFREFIVPRIGLLHPAKAIGAINSKLLEVGQIGHNDSTFLDVSKPFHSACEKRHSQRLHTMVWSAWRADCYVLELLKCHVTLRLRARRTGHAGHPPQGGPSATSATGRGFSQDPIV